MLKEQPQNGTTAPGETEKSHFNTLSQLSIFKTEKLFRVLLVLLIMIAGFVLANLVWALLAYFSGLLVLFATSWLVAVILYNPVHWLVRHGWQKMLAITVVYLGVTAIIAGFVVVVLPDLIAQMQLLLNNLGGVLAPAERLFNQQLNNLGLRAINFNDIASQVQTIAAELLKNALGIITGIANFAVQLLLLLIISFSILAGRSYDVRGRPKAMRRSTGRRNPDADPTLWGRLPPRYRRRVEIFRLNFERNFGTYLGGQLAIGIVYGMAVGVVMMAAGYDYALTTAVICGLIMVIPFFGGPLSLIPPLLVGLSKDGPLWIVMLILFVLQTLLLNVVLPKMVGRSTGFGPVITLFILLAGAQVAGVFGVLLAIPVAGLIKGVANSMVNDYMARETATVAVTTEVTYPENAPPEKINIDLEMSAPKVSPKQSPG
jgi:predicted PurR-regulated permease PerM